MISEELIADDCLFSPVPQNRHRHAAGIGGIGLGVDLVQEVEAVERIAGGAVLGQEGPAVGAHEMMDDRDGNHVLEFFQCPKDQRPVRPGTGKRDIEMVAARLGLEAARAAFGRPTVNRDPVAPLRLRPHEFAVARLGVVPAVLPFAVDQQSHAISFRLRRDVGTNRRCGNRQALNSSSIAKAANEGSNRRAASKTADCSG